jgi:hypothetical protein
MNKQPPPEASTVRDQDHRYRVPAPPGLRRGHRGPDHLRVLHGRHRHLGAIHDQRRARSGLIGGNDLDRFTVSRGFTHETPSFPFTITAVS